MEDRQIIPLLAAKDKHPLGAALLFNDYCFRSRSDVDLRDLVPVGMNSSGKFIFDYSSSYLEQVRKRYTEQKPDGFDAASASEDELMRYHESVLAKRLGNPITLREGLEPNLAWARQVVFNLEFMAGDTFTTIEPGYSGLQGKGNPCLVGQTTFSFLRNRELIVAEIRSGLGDEAYRAIEGRIFSNPSLAV